jgi:hypothetical protein
MISEPSLVQPPLIAAWLVDLFALDQQAGSIAGDLQEEFSDLASKSGVVSARRWYWRQSAKTIAYLIGTGFRIAPWSIMGAALGGYLLLALGGSLPEQMIVGVIHLRRHHVTPFYDDAHLAKYMLWLTTGILIGRLLFSLIIGCFVAAAAKGRELLATMTLGLVSLAMDVMTFWVLVARHQPVDPSFLRPIMVHQFAGSCMIIIGGIIVRESRSALSRRCSGS